MTMMMMITMSDIPFKNTLPRSVQSSRKTRKRCYAFNHCSLDPSLVNVQYGRVLCISCYPKRYASGCSSTPLSHNPDAMRLQCS